MRRQSDATRRATATQIRGTPDAHGRGMAHVKPSTTGSLVFVTLAAWFSLLFGLGLAGRLEDPPRALIPLVLLSLTTGTWLASRRTSVRTWVESLDVRALVAVHIVRWPIGMWFLQMYESGRLPGELAQLAGWGDIATGALAVVALAFDARTALGRRAVLVFNTLGLVDILLVVGTAQKVLFFAAAPVEIGFPFVLLPMFVVPLVIVAHLWTFVRLRSVTAASHSGPSERARTIAGAA